MNKTLRITLNVLILLVVAGFIWYIARSMVRQEVTYAEIQLTDSVSSSRKLLSSIELPREVNRFEIYEGRLFAIAADSLHIYDRTGNPFSSFPLKDAVRDIAVEQGDIYILYPTAIEVYTDTGQLSHRWEACSELSDYCSLAVAGGFVFVTDAENKNICKYTREGGFVQFISSPNGFIIPSYSFDIAVWNDTVYCANSGRHLVESYSLEGNYLTAFGSAGAEPGAFAGCCNPAYIAFTPQGEIVTSEKGNPRISLYGRDGSFKEILFNSRMLGGGNKACEVKAAEEVIFVGGKNRIQVYENDETVRLGQMQMHDSDEIVKLNRMQVCENDVTVRLKACRDLAQGKQTLGCATLGWYATPQVGVLKERWIDVSFFQNSLSGDVRQPGIASLRSLSQAKYRHACGVTDSTG